MWRYLVIASFLAGCTAPGGILRGTGEEIEPPFGYLMYCAQYPNSAECGGNK